MFLIIIAIFFVFSFGMIAGIKTAFHLKPLILGLIYALPGVLMFGFYAFFADLSNSMLVSMRDWIIAAFYLAVTATLLFSGAIAGVLISRR